MQRDMSRRELAVFVLAMYAWFVILIVAFDDFPSRILRTGDNPSYAAESAAVRGMAPANFATRHFFGYPMASAAVATIFRTSDAAAMVIVSMIASIAAVLLVGELWGGVIAAWFAVVNIDWVQRSLCGGAEPLFVVLIFLGILAARRDRWTLAAVFAALSTIVRPLGFFLLVAIGIELLRRRRPTALAAAAGISVTIGAAYLGLLRLLFHDAFGNFRWYSSMGLAHDRTFIPFVTLFLSHGEHPLTKRNIVKALVWMTLTLAGVVAAIVRRPLREHRVEWLFAAIYLASFLFFPAWWIEGEYSRYLTPVIPMLFVALAPWIPSNRVVLWLGGFACVTLAAVKDMPAFRLF